jgi:hypothetical protein
MKFIKDDHFRTWYIDKIKELQASVPPNPLYMPTEDSNKLVAMMEIYREYERENDEH